MRSPPLTRNILPDQRVELRCGDSRFVYHHLRPGLLLVTFIGDDLGQFGRLAVDEVRMHLLGNKALELFIHAGGAQTVSVEVTQEWTRFFSECRSSLKRVSVLTGSKFFHLSASISQHLSMTGNLIQIYTDRELFDQAMAAAAAGR